jgi:hypothetical protein
MSSCDNKKTQDKDFIKRYGDTTVFSYGCSPDGGKHYFAGPGHMPPVTDLPRSDIYVYRMTMTNEDGFVVEYTPDFMRYRCEQMGIKTVQVFANEIIPHYTMLHDAVGSPQETNAGEYAMQIAEKFCDGPDPVGKSHVREGVVVRILNRPKFCAYKHKNFSFKVLEGIAKVEAEAPDMEEAQDVEDARTESE